MGVKLSIDKHVSNLEEVLEISAQYYSKVKFESKIKEEITHHLKVSPIQVFWDYKVINWFVDLAVFGRLKQIRLGQNIPNPSSPALAEQLQIHTEGGLSSAVYFQDWIGM